MLAIVECDGRRSFTEIERALDTRCVPTSTGDHRLMLEISMRNERELTKLITDSINTIEGVKRICPALILERL
jgi:Lrp/AsnC family transcriptional regulator for asnA, asnC and gidA